MNLYLPSAEATATFAQTLAAHRPAQAVVYLYGDLGAGKSTLARAMLRALGVTGTVRSPTYTLVERYPLAEGGEALHLDLYRIGDAGELEFLGLDQTDARLWLVEWPERGSGALPQADLHLHLHIEGDGRRLHATSCSDRGQAWLAAVAVSVKVLR